jgi:hypothetical protein
MFNFACLLGHPPEDCPEGMAGASRMVSRHKRTASPTLTPVDNVVTDFELLVPYRHDPLHEFVEQRYGESGISMIWAPDHPLENEAGSKRA